MEGDLIEQLEGEIGHWSRERGKSGCGIPNLCSTLCKTAISCPGPSPLALLYPTRRMALQSQSRPEPMNATPHHSKVKVSVTLSDSFYIAGSVVTGKLALESRTDKGLGLGIIMVELVAIEGRFFSLYPLTVFPQIDTLLSRTNFSRSFSNLNVPTHPTPLSRTWLASFECCTSPPRRRGAPSTGASPPRAARTYNLPLSSPSPTLLPAIYRFWKRTCQDTI